MNGNSHCDEETDCRQVTEGQNHVAGHNRRNQNRYRDKEQRRCNNKEIAENQSAVKFLCKFFRE